MIPPKIKELNERHFVVSVGGKTRVATERDSKGNLIPIELSSFQDFRERYSNQYVLVPVGGEGEEIFDPIRLGTYWLRHPQRRQYDRIVFDPSGTAPATVYNLWRGFNVEPREGDWSLFHEHIRTVICRGDPQLFDYVMGWMAHAVQHPDQPGEVALVLRGAKGTGKGTFANAFGHLFGDNYLAISNSLHLTGHFNAHLGQTIVLLVDEGFWAGGKRGEGVLKQLVTEPTLPIERKYYDVEQVRNRLHVIVASNESWVVPASGLERRFCVLDISDERAGDTEYFGAIRRQLSEGGFEAMLHDLLHYDLSGFNVRKPPKTAALRDQIIHSFAPFAEWWYGRLLDGQLLRSRPGWRQGKVEDLYADYLEDVGNQRPLSRAKFASELRKLVPSLLVERPRQGNKERARFYRFPSLEICRAEWDRQYGLEPDWPSDDDAEAA